MLICYLPMPKPMSPESSTRLPPNKSSHWWHCAQDNSFDHRASTQQRGSQNKEDNCKASSQEICGNKVSTCHGCEMLLKPLMDRSIWDNGLLRHIQRFCSLVASHGFWRLQKGLTGLCVHEPRALKSQGSSDFPCESQLKAHTFVSVRVKWKIVTLEDSAPAEAWHDTSTSIYFMFAVTLFHNVSSNFL